jgi:hypothetical protein
MKKLLILALLFMVLQVRSQTFEGTVKWTARMEITDPKLKAEMEQVQKKMNDPATEAKLKELEAKMNDPKTKAQLDANPQLKAQMENTLKMMKGGGGANAMMPTGLIMKIKGNNTITIMEGGMMNGYEILHMKDKNQSVRLDRPNKIYMTMPGGGQANKSTPAMKVTKTGETAKILGYNATKYLAESTERGEAVTTTFWTTTDIKDIDMKALTNQRMGPGGKPMLPDGVEGVPLKIENATAQGNMVMEVTEIRRESLNAADFTIPADFKEGKRF